MSFKKYESIPNLQNQQMVELIKTKYGDTIAIALEKFHGTHVAITAVDGRRENIKLSTRSGFVENYTDMEKAEGFEDACILACYFALKHQQPVQLEMELIGRGIVASKQIDYLGNDNKALVAYDLRLLKDNLFILKPTLFRAGQTHAPNLRMAPVVETGMFKNLLDFKLKESLLFPGVPSEGYVVSCLEDQYIETEDPMDTTRQRVTMKVIMDEFKENDDAPEKPETLQEVAARMGTEMRLVKVAATHGILKESSMATNYKILQSLVAADIVDDMNFPAHLKNANACDNITPFLKPVALSFWKR